MDMSAEVPSEGPFERVRYYAGQLLSTDDLRAEQEYAAAKRRLHNRALHGFGVVSGLSVAVADGDAGGLTISPGLALSPTGDEIVVTAPVLLDLPCDPSYCPKYVVVRYLEELVDPVVVPGADGEDAVELTRVREVFELELVDQPGDGDVVLATVAAVSASADGGASAPVISQAPTIG